MNRIEIIFGIGVDQAGQNISNEQRGLALHNIHHRAAQMFGGYTSICDATGGWQNGESYIIEPAAVLIIYYNEDDLDPMVQELIQLIETELNQKSVLAFKSKVQPI